MMVQVNRGLQSSFLLRNVSAGVPFELRLFTYSPTISRIEVLHLARRRRAKLYYLRGRPEKVGSPSLLLYCLLPTGCYPTVGPCLAALSPHIC